MYRVRTDGVRPSEGKATLGGDAGATRRGGRSLARAQWWRRCLRRRQSKRRALPGVANSLRETLALCGRLHPDKTLEPSSGAVRGPDFTVSRGPVWETESPGRKLVILQSTEQSAYRAPGADRSPGLVGQGGPCGRNRGEF